MRRRRWPSRQAATSSPWRSGLEEKIAADLTERGVRYRYEKLQITYERPSEFHKYTPDFQLENGIIIESKGYLDLDDRKKHLWVKTQLPDLDIRFVFQRSSNPLRKGSKTTYADWCRKNGFQFSEKLVPQEWIDEAPRTN